MDKKIAVIIGAGPAGLTAAYELLKQTDIKPIVIESQKVVGGISATHEYKGNRIDVGGHRFFTKSDKVLKWWLDILPMEAVSDPELEAVYKKRLESIGVTKEGLDAEVDNKVMLVRRRRSRILFLGKLFDYPVQLNWPTVSKLGLGRMAKVGVSYIRSVLWPIKPEVSLEDFFINRFGRELYKTFFKSYSEKLWGVACSDISAEWGAQRVKGLSVAEAVKHFVKVKLGFQSTNIKKLETSLIDHFLYPKFGPGQLWEEVAVKVKRLGGEIMLECVVDSVRTEAGRVVAVEVINKASGVRVVLKSDYVFSSMPVSTLAEAMGEVVPRRIQEIAAGLPYRDFITVGLLLERFGGVSRLLSDNWLYVQEPGVRMGRIQIFNNWSPYMVADKDKVWLGLEYFCSDRDVLWKMSDEQVVDMAVNELIDIDMAYRDDVLDSVVVRMPKAYPAYFGTYKDFSDLREYFDGFKNLLLIGRNGTHRYNNQDHSMLSAMRAVECITKGGGDKSQIWTVNTEKSYLEGK